MRGSKTKFPGEVEVYFYFITGGGGGFEAYIPKFNYEPSEI